MNWTFCSRRKKRKNERLLLSSVFTDERKRMTPPPSSPTRRVVARLLALSKSCAAPFKSSPFFRFGTPSFETHHHLDRVVVAKVLGKHRCLCSTFSTKGTGRTRDVSAVLSTRGPTWSVNELVRGGREDDEESDGSARRGEISDEEFRKTVESVKLSFEKNPKGEQLAKREVEEILRFSEMVLGEKKSDTEGEAEGTGLYKSNGPTHRRRADE